MNEVNGNAKIIQREQLCHAHRLSYFPIDGRAPNGFEAPFSHKPLTDHFAKLQEVQIMVPACNNRQSDWHTLSSNECWNMDSGCVKSLSKVR